MTVRFTVEAGAEFLKQVGVEKMEYHFIKPLVLVAEDLACGRRCSNCHKPSTSVETLTACTHRNLGLSEDHLACDGYEKCRYAKGKQLPRRPSLLKLFIGHPEEVKDRRLMINEFMKCRHSWEELKVSNAIVSAKKRAEASQARTAEQGARKAHRESEKSKVSTLLEEMITKGKDIRAATIGKTNIDGTEATAE